MDALEYGWLLLIKMDMHLEYLVKKNQTESHIFCAVQQNGYALEYKKTNRSHMSCCCSKIWICIKICKNQTEEICIAVKQLARI